MGAGTSSPVAPHSPILQLRGCYRGSGQVPKSLPLQPWWLQPCGGGGFSRSHGDGGGGFSHGGSGGGSGRRVPSVQCVLRVLPGVLWACMATPKLPVSVGGQEAASADPPHWHLWGGTPRGGFPLGVEGRAWAS